VESVSDPIALDAAGAAANGSAHWDPRATTPPKDLPAGSLRAAVRAADGYDLLVVALICVIAAARFVFVPGSFRADTWLTLAAGREIWHSGIPHEDTWTTLSAGRKWIDQQWLSQLTTFGLYRLGGFGLVGFAAVSCALSAVAAAVRAAKRTGASGRSLLLLTPLTVLPFMVASFEVRAQMFALPLFMAVFLLLRADSRASSRRVYLTLPLLALWANLHGSVTLGVALVALRGLTVGWERRRMLLGRGRAWLRPAALTILPVLTLFLTPYGISVVPYYRATLFSGWFSELVTEWQPVTSAPLPAALFFGLAGIALWSFGRNPGKTTLWERAALVLLMIAAVSAIRNLVWVALAAIPVVAVSIDPSVRRETGDESSQRRINGAVAIAAVVCVAAAALSTLARPGRAFEKAYPSSVLAAVRAARSAEPTANVLADVSYADWLLWRDPGLRGHVAFDGRFELLSHHGIRTLEAVAAGERSRLEALPYRLVVLHPRESAAAVRIFRHEPGARVLDEDRRGIVILRRPESR
jgi:hypothetical protein